MAALSLWNFVLSTSLFCSFFFPQSSSSSYFFTRIGEFPEFHSRILCIFCMLLRAMASPCSSDTKVALQKTAFEELVRGKQLTLQLQSMLRRPLGSDSSASVADLASKILGSFTATISLLNSGDTLVRVPASARVAASPCPDDGVKCEDSGESCDNSAKSYRRGNYKRRKNLKTWTRKDPRPVEDGHAWRKYGQKVILNAQYPRNYYRCTHKSDQECKATKQVQRVGEEPPVYRTTYFGLHTCNKNINTLKLDPTNSERQMGATFPEYEGSLRIRSPDGLMLPTAEAPPPATALSASCTGSTATTPTQNTETDVVMLIDGSMDFEYLQEQVMPYL